MQYKLVSWNINGLRAALKKGFWEKVNELQPDILAVQEIKTDAITMEVLAGQALMQEENYKLIYHSAQKKGYSGTAIFYNPSNYSVTKVFTGIENEIFDIEGRMTGLYLEFPGYNKPVVLLNGYFPQGGREGRVAYKIEFYREVYNFTKNLIAQGCSVIVTGDLNTTVGDIDLARPKENRNTTGCLPEEREALDWFIKEDFVDTFRYFYPDLTDQYTYWDQITRARERNVGWRIDYFLITKDLLPHLKQASILPEFMGSDHCPLSIVLEFND